MVFAFLTLHLSSTSHAQQQKSLFTDSGLANVQSKTPPGQIPLDQTPHAKPLTPQIPTSPILPPQMNKPVQTITLPHKSHIQVIPLSTEKLAKTPITQKPVARTYQHPQPQYPSITRTHQQLAPQSSVQQQEVIQRVLQQPASKQLPQQFPLSARKLCPQGKPIC